MNNLVFVRIQRNSLQQAAGILAQAIKVRPKKNILADQKRECQEKTKEEKRIYK